MLRSLWNNNDYVNQLILNSDNREILKPYQ